MADSAVKIGLKMSEHVTTATFERDFRCLLVRLVEELGDEKFKFFCFILSVPEAIRERHRTDVLWHLWEQGKLSPRRPRDLVRLLRDDLHRDDLATQAETAIGKLSFTSYLSYLYFNIYTKHISFGVNSDGKLHGAGNLCS